MNYQEVFSVNHAVPAMFGVGVSELIGKKMKELGATKVLFIYDTAMKQLGTGPKLAEFIRAEGIEVIEYFEILHEPTSDQIDEIGNMAREVGVNGLVGLGGGSSMDTTKAVNLLLSNPGSICDYISANRGKKPIVKKYPAVFIPTTAGTSSEVKNNFVTTDSTTGKKTGANCGGDLALIDPALTIGVPPYVTAYTGMDMLAHAAESLTNAAPNWMSDFMDEKAIELIFQYLPTAVADGKNMEARTMLSFACFVTGYAFADKGTHIGHAIADKLSNEYHFPHGVGCALGLPVAMRYAAEACPDQVRRIAKCIGIAEYDTLPEKEIGEKVIAAFNDLRLKVGFKTMKQMGVSEELIDYIIQEFPNDVRFKGKPYCPDFEIAARALRAEYAVEA